MTLPNIKLSDCGDAAWEANFRYIWDLLHGQKLIVEEWTDEDKKDLSQV